MIVKRGIVVSHTVVKEWGVGKVMEVTPDRATIQFSDGILRKIAASHYTSLQPADSALYLLLPSAAAVPAVRAARKTTKKVKVATV